MSKNLRFFGPSIPHKYDTKCQIDCLIQKNSNQLNDLISTYLALCNLYIYLTEYLKKIRNNTTHAEEQIDLYNITDYGYNTIFNIA